MDYLNCIVVVCQIGDEFPQSNESMDEGKLQHCKPDPALPLLCPCFALQHCKPDPALPSFLQILEVNIFEKKPISSQVAEALKQNPEQPACNQPELFNY